ncbi:MAG: c-type cytochrome [Vicinamibacterales bacterium]
MPGLIRTLGASLLLVVSGVALAAQAPTGNGPRTGADDFREYCAGCHGRSGRGDGPVASTLATRLPDLGTLAEGNGGTFPRQRVKGAILNVQRPITATRTGDMPVWAHVFSAIERDNARLEQRIDGLVGFVETLQRPVVANVGLGKALFAAYCVACHPLSTAGGDAPALEEFAMRNGGLFPAARLAEIIDGRGISAHGSPAMPRWGEVFQVIPGEPGAAAAAARLAAITDYLESIQLRASH